MKAYELSQTKTLEKKIADVNKTGENYAKRMQAYEKDQTSYLEKKIGEVRSWAEKTFTKK